MTMLDPIVADRLERSRRRAIRTLTIVLGLAGVFCAFLMVNILNPPARNHRLGAVGDFPVGALTQISIPRLSVSDTIQNRQEVSDDPIFVLRRADGTWQAILGWDSESGCLVLPIEPGDAGYPRLGAGGFRDPCSDRVYDERGYLISDNRLLRLGSLPVEVAGDDVLVRDQFIPDERQGQ